MDVDKDRDIRQCDHKVDALELFSDGTYYTDKAIAAKREDDMVSGWPFSCANCKLSFTKNEIKSNL